MVAFKAIWRAGLAYGIPILLLYLAWDATAHISGLYDGLCELQGPGMARLLYDGSKSGYCTGIGDDLVLLRLISGLGCACLCIVILCIFGLVDKAAEGRRRRASV